MHKSAKRANHQPGANQQDERQRDLHDDQSVSRAMLLAALAERASSLAEAGVQMRAGILEDWNRAEQQTGKKRDRERKQKHRHINPDFVEAWKARGRHRNKYSQRSIGERQSEQASHQAENRALEHQFPCNAFPSRAQSPANGQFLAASFDAHKQQVRHVRTSDQQNHGDRAHQNPQNVAHITDDVLLQWPQVGRDLRFFEELHAEAFRRRKASIGDEKQARHVRAGLRHSHAGLETRKSLIAVVAELYFVAIKPEGHDKRQIIVVEKMKVSRQYPDDLARLSVERDGAPDH